MKIFVFLILTLFFAVVSYADCGYSHSFINNIHGSVKSLDYQIFKGVDRFGEISEGEKEESHIFNFNKDNQVISIEIKNYNYTVNPVTHHIIKYDDDCHIATEKVDSDGNLLSKNINKYNNKLLTENSLYNKDGSLLSRKIYEYNDNNELIELHSYNIEGKLTMRIIYERDSNGNTIKTEQEDQYGTNSITLMEYNEDGYITKMTRTNRNNGTVTNVTYSYFDFDENNNWTKMHIFSNNVIQKIIIRVLEYN